MAIIHKTILAPINKICLNSLILWTLDPIDLAIEGLGGWGKKKKKSLEIWRLTYWNPSSSILQFFFFSVFQFVCLCVWVLRVQIRKKSVVQESSNERWMCEQRTIYTSAANSLTETKLNVFF
jgi:hypothetical protein